MTAHVNLEELLAAFEWMSAGEAAGSESEAFVSKATGSIHWSGDAVDEELPEDIEDEGKYVTVPRKSELDLGRPLALRFVDERLPGSYELARQYFGKRGAYARFKAMLERAGQLEAWYEYEERAIEEAMIAWADENGFVLDRPPSSGGTRARAPDLQEDFLPEPCHQAGGPSAGLICSTLSAHAPPTRMPADRPPPRRTAS